MNRPMPTLAARLGQVSFSYGHQAILHQVSLAVRPGEFLAIIGPNGCGKSTLLKLLAGLLRPSAGQVLIDGLDITGFSRRQLAKRLALLAQSSGLPDGMLVSDLVSMGRYMHESWLKRQTPEDRRQVTRAMQRMAIDTLADRPLGQLSGGQLQRARMAMTLAQDAPILLLDEPTNHLDLKHQYGVLDIARSEARAGRAVVAVLHDLTQASLYADRLILMHQGRIAAMGTSATVLTDDNIADVYGIRTRLVAVGKAVIPIPLGALE